MKWCRLLLAVVSLFGSHFALGDDEFDRPPINYSSSTSRDPVAKWLESLASGKEKLEKDENGSYLKAALRALQVPESSQSLVFSKTSLQITYISPQTPRAIYFNDSVYVGSVIGSPIIELASIDPQLGCVFYTLERQEDDYRIIRDRGQCLSCHATSRTEQVPGVLVRSIYSDKAGRPRSGSSSYTTDHRSPFAQRWGGWYVTGQHGSMRHLGNIFALDRDDPQRVDMELGANLTKLPKSVSSSTHLNEESDIVALMVLEHQSRLHNLITRANFETRQATYLDKSMNEALGRLPDYVSESTSRRIASVGDALISGLLFADEIELSSPVQGASGFTEYFSHKGPTDSKGRSFYQLDLQKRMFRWPLSYLILSEHFDGLPSPVATYVKNELSGVLLGRKQPPKGVKLEREQRLALVDMLQELKPNWLDKTLGKEISRSE